MHVAVIYRIPYAKNFFKDVILVVVLAVIAYVKIESLNPWTNYNPVSGNYRISVWKRVNLPSNY